MSLGIIIADRRTRFANRFEPDRDGYVYRAETGDAGYRVTAEQRDEFVRRYNRALDLSFVGVFLGMLSVTSLAIEVFKGPLWPPLPSLAIGAGLIIVFVAFEAFDRWSGNAPNRALRRRVR
jgi:hypothetical protein